MTTDPGTTYDWYESNAKNYFAITIDIDAGAPTAGYNIAWLEADSSALGSITTSATIINDTTAAQLPHGQDAQDKADRAPQANAPELGGWPVHDLVGDGIRERGERRAEEREQAHGEQGQAADDLVGTAQAFGHLTEHVQSGARMTGEMQ